MYGLIVDAAGRPVNHRTPMKVLLNPLLRLVGWEIGSLIRGTTFLGYRMVRCPRGWSGFCFNYRLRPGDRLNGEK